MLLRPPGPAELCISWDGMKVAASVAGLSGPWQRGSRASIGTEPAAGTPSAPPNVAAAKDEDGAPPPALPGDAAGCARAPRARGARGSFKPSIVLRCSAIDLRAARPRTARKNGSWTGSSTRRWQSQRKLRPSSSGKAWQSCSG